MVPRGTPRIGDAGPRRVWPLAVAFGLGSALVVALVAVWVARASSDAAEPAHPTDGVVIVGDSITQYGEAVLVDVLAPVWEPLVIDGREGFTVAEQQSTAEALAEEEPMRVVINLGTNDVMQDLDLDDSVDDLRTMVATFPDASCILLVTIHEGLGFGDPTIRPRARQMNGAIAAMAADDERIHVVDWAGTVAVDEAAPPAGAEPIIEDTVHPSPRGQHVLAEMYADSLAGCPAPSISTPAPAQP